MEAMRKELRQDVGRGCFAFLSPSNGIALSIMDFGVMPAIMPSKLSIWVNDVMNEGDHEPSLRKS